ncbi:MAG: Bax inhibitor-1/YccA family protein [Rickettsiales bacterium]|nr:Bax inhibitor-1/YccA family protein [Rickettsiales bacterium]
MTQDYTKFNNRSASVSQVSADVDQGLRSYMLVVYNYMAAALALTGVVAYTFYATGLLQTVFTTASLRPLAYVIMFAPLGFVFFLMFRIHKLSFKAAQTSFWIYASLVGLSFSSIFMVYTGVSIAKAFFITASIFGSMSIYGYTTKKDLSGMGSFLFMALIGVILVSIINFFFIESSMLSFLFDIAMVLIFVGFTAYDTQNIKQGYFLHGGSGEAAGKAAVWGALSLYINFIAIFINLLQLIGNQE